MKVQQFFDLAHGTAGIRAITICPIAGISLSFKMTPGGRTCFDRALDQPTRPPSSLHGVAAVHGVDLAGDVGSGGGG